jgi:hypothetical protein
MGERAAGVFGCVFAFPHIVFLGVISGAALPPPLFLAAVMGACSASHETFNYRKFLQNPMPMVHAVVLDAEEDPTIGGGLRPNQQSGTWLFFIPSCGR